MKAAGIWIVILLLVAITCRGAGAAPSELESRFRREMSHIDAKLDEPPLHERLVAIANERGVTRAEVQALLLEISQAEIVSSLGDTRSPSLQVAGAALSTLAHIADATAIEELRHIAENPPKAVEVSALQALVYTTSRERPRSLPTFVEALTAGKSFSHVYPLLHSVLRYQLPSAPEDREELIEVINGIFRKGIRNPQYGDRVFLDRVLEQYDPEFRESEERREILLQLVYAAEGENAKEYARGKLNSVFGQTNPEAARSIASERSLVASESNGQGTSPSAHSESQEPAPESLFQRHHVSAIVVGSTLILLLALLAWGVNRR